jgi:hypothetical protein
MEKLESRDFFIGSASENVVKHSERAVLVVKEESEELLFKALLKSEEQTQ